MSIESEPLTSWSVEEIPNQDFLFYRVHKNYIVEGKLIPGVFKEIGDNDKKSMSTDWSKYSTPEESWKRSRNPDDNGLIKLLVEKVRAIEQQTVTHAPDIINKNRSHTDIKGVDQSEKKLKTKIRAKYMSIFEWIIKHELVID